MELIQMFLGSKSMKIIDETSGIQKWSGLAIISVEIMASSNSSDIPVAATSMQVVSVYEGSLISNMQANKVLTPSSLNINAVCTDVSTMENIISSFKDLEATYKITSRNIISEAMALVNVEIAQTPENVSGVVLRLAFEQTSKSSDSGFNPLQSADQDSLGVSSQESETLTSTVTGLYNNIKSKIGL